LQKNAFFQVFSADFEGWLPAPIQVGLIDPESKVSYSAAHT